MASCKMTSRELVENFELKYLIPSSKLAKAPLKIGDVDSDFYLLCTACASVDDDSLLMESLSETKWDVVIAGTGLPQSLLALSLSHSGKKVIHLDRNDYYGGSEAAFSLQEAEKWAERVRDDHFSSFSGARITIANQLVSEANSTKLGPSRSYTLSLSPQLLYAQSALLPVLVTSRVHTQLEFQAVGSWWTYQHKKPSSSSALELQDANDTGKERSGALKKIPSSREDVFSDNTISIRDKRALMKFLRYVLQEPVDTVEPSTEANGEESLGHLLSSKFSVSTALQQPLLALSLSQGTLDTTEARQALQRMRRHLRSIGTFGPGFGAMIPKYGGGAEIAQVGCRAGAVGGGVYVLGRGIHSIQPLAEAEQQDQSTNSPQRETFVKLSDGETISAKYVIGGDEDIPQGSTIRSPPESTGGYARSARSISIISSPLSHLFPPTSENGPIPAGAVVMLGHVEESDAPGMQGSLEAPVYLLVHSSDSGECPTGQCVIYGSTSSVDEGSEARLAQAVNTLASTADENVTPRTLWSLFYVQTGTPVSASTLSSVDLDESGHVMKFPIASLDLAFGDGLIDCVRAAWKKIMGHESEDTSFMQFEDREELGDDEDG